MRKRATGSFSRVARRAGPQTGRRSWCCGAHARRALRQVGRTQAPMRTAAPVRTSLMRRVPSASIRFRMRTVLTGRPRRGAPISACSNRPGRLRAKTGCSLNLWRRLRRDFRTPWCKNRSPVRRVTECLDSSTVGGPRRHPVIACQGDLAESANPDDQVRVCEASLACDA